MFEVIPSFGLRLILWPYGVGKMLRDSAFNVVGELRQLIVLIILLRSCHCSVDNRFFASGSAISVDPYFNTVTGWALF
jgi:hypothetical protein